MFASAEFVTFLAMNWPLGSLSFVRSGRAHRRTTRRAQPRMGCHCTAIEDYRQHHLGLTPVDGAASPSRDPILAALGLPPPDHYLCMEWDNAAGDPYRPLR